MIPQNDYSGGTTAGDLGSVVMSPTATSEEPRRLHISAGEVEKWVEETLYDAKTSANYRGRTSIIRDYEPYESSGPKQWLFSGKKIIILTER